MINVLNLDNDIEEILGMNFLPHVENYICRHQKHCSHLKAELVLQGFPAIH